MRYSSGRHRPPVNPSDAERFSESGGVSPCGVLGVLTWTAPSGRLRTRPLFSLRRTLRRSVTNARVRACWLHADHRPPPALAARPAATCSGVPPAAATAQPGRDVRLGRGTADAPKPPPTRAGRGRRWTAAQPTPVPIMPIRPITPIAPIIPIIPIMPIMLCRRGRSMRHVQRIAQLEIDVQSAQQHSGGND